MDLEHILHRKHTVALWVGIVLSLATVVIAAGIGRGTVSLAGALVLPEPTDITAIAVIEPILAPEHVTISDVQFLRKKVASLTNNPTYDYLIRRSDGASMLIGIGKDHETGAWTLFTQEMLHGQSANVERTMEKQVSL